MIALLRRYLLSPQLRDYWDKLESVDRHAVAEAAHNWDGRFYAVRFVNKYSDIPETFRAENRLGGSRQSRKRSSALSLFFRLNPLGAWCLDLCDGYQAAEAPFAPLLTLSEDLRIELVRAAEPGKVLLLDRYAERISERTWLLTAESVLRRRRIMAESTAEVGERSNLPRILVT